MNKHPLIFAVSGVKNSGKTTLIQRLIPKFTAQGLQVATIKHDGHTLSTEPPDTDSFLHRKAGAYASAVYDDTKAMLVICRPMQPDQLIALFPTADVIILEGLKHSLYPKIEVIRKKNGNNLIANAESTFAVVADFTPTTTAPVFAFEDLDLLFAAILRYFAQ